VRCIGYDVETWIQPRLDWLMPSGYQEKAKGEGGAVASRLRALYNAEGLVRI
jgi:hypothetical protein